MDTNPSPEWTPLERLQVIQEHVANAMNTRLIINPEKTAEVMDIIGVLTSQSSEFLEQNRGGVLSLTIA